MKGFMQEKSAYEGHLDRTGIMCVGQVVSVTQAEAAGRRLRVKTFGGTGADDLDLPNVRILGNWHVDGDEDMCIPRIGTFGLLTFVKTEVFWLGAFPLDAASGENQRKNMEVLNPGDRVIKTKYGNKFILRTGGTVEMSSADLCSLLMTPNHNLIAMKCQNWELETSGGVIKWNVDPDTDDALAHFSFWDNIDPSFICTLDVGTVPDTNNEGPSALASLAGASPGQVNISAPDAADLMLDFKLGTVASDLSIDKRALRIAAKSDGSFYIDIGPDKFTMLVDAKTGDVQWQTQGKVTASVKSDLALSVTGKTTIDGTGDVSLTTKGKLAVDALGGAAITTKGKATIEATGGASITTKGSASIDATGPCRVA